MTTAAQRLSIERKQQACLRELLFDAGLTEMTIDLHAHLLKRDRWHTSDELAEHFDVVKHTLFRWCAVLVEKGLVLREEAPGDEEEGGRLPSQFMANRARMRTPLRAAFEKRSKLVVAAWTLGKDLEAKVGA